MTSLLAASGVHETLGELRGNELWGGALPSLLADFTALLRDALDLMRDLGAADYQTDFSYVNQPSITEHGQNSALHDWTALIELNRDAWRATAAESTGPGATHSADLVTAPLPGVSSPCVLCSRAALMSSPPARDSTGCWRMTVGGYGRSRPSERPYGFWWHWRRESINKELYSDSNTPYLTDRHAICSNPTWTSNAGRQ